MKGNSNKIDSLVSKILQEEIEKRANEVVEKFGQGEWKEIVTEKLHGKQDFIAKQAKPKNKITADDFKELRKKKSHKKEMDEESFFDDEHVEDAEEASQQEPTYVGKGLEDNKIKADLTNKLFGSFDDEHGWWDEKDYPFKGEFDFDYEEEEFPDFDSLMSSPYAKKQMWFAPERSDAKKHGMVGDGRKFFDLYQKKFGGKPFRIRKMRGLEEAETEEGNAFTDKLRKTPKGGKFTLGGKSYTDNSNLEEGKKCPKCGMTNCKCNHKEETKEEKKWIQKTDMKKGALHKKLNVPQDEKIPQEKLKSIKKKLMDKAEGDKKLSKEDSKLLKQVNLAQTLKGLKESNKKLRVTEEELIDMIETIVMEQKEVAEKVKSNISDKKKSNGLAQTEKVLSKDKDENNQNLKRVEAKLKDYLKKGPKAKFEMNPKDFPKGMGELGETKKKAYKASDAVEEYIDNFAYPGLENTKYDEIKPNDQWLEDNLVGTSKTGNNPEWANAVKTEVGEKVNKKRIKNAYQKEKQKSYNRYTQPVDEAGEHEGEASLDKMFAKLESVEEKKSGKINEDIEKMKNLISYNQKTQ
jgi:hypothetical protein